MHRHDSAAPIHNPGMSSHASVDSVLHTIGRTPLVRLRRLVEPGMADVVVKLEYFNPTGSYKDRMALAMIEGAEKRGALRKGSSTPAAARARLWPWCAP